MLEWTIVFAFPVLMALAASYDMLTMTIPNRISLALGVSFLAAAAVAGLPLGEFGLHLLAAATVFAVAFACFAFGWIGGGDAKLATAAALWLGWGHVLEYAVLFSICGGLLTLGIILARLVPLPPVLDRTGWIVRLHDRRTGIPYGIALAAAALLIFPETTWGRFL